MSAQFAIIASGVSSPEWGSESSDVFDITNSDISCTKFISGDRHADKYNDLGRNITAQGRRQALVPWVISDPASKGGNHSRLDVVYDKFQFKYGDDYVWSDGSKIYSTNPFIC